MKYSLIIPAYNCESFIEDGLNSVLPQLREDCELILVDDGSTDHTRDQLSKYENRKNVTVIYSPHRGASAARNTGIRAARGEYISFLDCDDRLKPLPFLNDPGFFAENADLYIFGIERIFFNGEKVSWTIPDRIFQTVSDFADAFIREHKFLIYSNGNKLYRRSIIEQSGLLFEEGTEFGEDRLFNFCYLKYCGKILTSSLVIYEYLQRSPDSMSGRTMPGYFKTILQLHEAKMDCFLSLSKGCTKEEQAAYIAYDLCSEIEKAIAHFQDHPDEERESISIINALIFKGPDGACAPIDPSSVSGPDTWYLDEQEKKRVLNEFNKYLTEASLNGLSV